MHQPGSRVAALVAGLALVSCGEQTLVHVTVQSDGVPPADRLDVTLSIGGSVVDTLSIPAPDGVPIAYPTAFGMRLLDAAASTDFDLLVTAFVGATAAGAATTSDTVQRGETIFLTVVLTTDIDCGALDDDCNVGTWNPAALRCEAMPRPGGEPCDDGLFCTDPDYCTGGSCGGDVRSCGAMPCQMGCDEAADACIPMVVPDGEPCNDGDFCTTGETCLTGTCQGGGPRDCSGLDDGCNLGVCNSAAAACERMAMNEGGPCNDGLFCTESETCSSGTCSGPARDCGGDVCSGVLCDEALDQCTSVPVMEGTPCNDASACTSMDQCVGGRCMGSGVAEYASTNCADGVDNDCDGLADAADASACCTNAGCTTACAGACCREECTTSVCTWTCPDGCVCGYVCPNRPFIGPATCNIVCPAGATCDINCTGGSCTQVDCTGGGQCLLRCGSSTCGFTACTGGTGELSCPGGMLACNRPCP